MTTIIERLKAATGPDRKIDNAIAEKFNDWHYSTNGIARECHHYTASIDAALALVERMLPRRAGNMFWACGNLTASIVHADGQQPWFGGASPAIAILIALFTALEAKDGRS